MSTQLSTPESFSALQRLYGSSSVMLLPTLRFCVVGVGGVGSWTVEALARCGVGHITIIDHDDVTESNINRQIHADVSTIGESKVDLMRQRVERIHPDCDLQAIDDFLAETNLANYLSREFDVVIDAIDSIRFKAAMIYYCKRNKIEIITTGGAGGRTDPLAVDVCDLSKTWNDALAAKVRSRLRSEYGFSKNPKSRFGVECVYSHEQPVYPDGHGSVTHQKPGVPGATLDCDQGYGSVSFVTGTFGFVAASRALNNALKKRSSQ
ncbi:MAG: tRNA cyclic N6-threonylcarbamoyladenosine(37) synthase TcdA [Gammaproteobacteria bacterium]|nr:tRNA cyclic N6-threonylcarbamoyladenosine(37) synthase TcdA [Gammaproteobacteria bacterium]